MENIPYGFPLGISAILDPPPGAGAVTFTDSGTPVPECTNLDATPSSVTCNASTLPPGQHTISASFSAPGLESITANTPLTVTISKSATTLRYTGPTRLAIGDRLTASATLMNTQLGDTYARPVPGGVVSFSFDGQSCAGHADPLSGIASCTFDIPPSPGTARLQINYLGDNNYGGSSTSQLITISNSNPQMTIMAVPSTSPWGQSVTMSAFLPADATGTVTFSSSPTDSPPSKCSAPVSMGFAACMIAAQLQSGIETINAVYSGDAVYKSATAQQNITVTTHEVELAISDLTPTDPAVGTVATFTVTATDSYSGLPVSDLPVSGQLGDSPINCIATSSGGRANCSFTADHATSGTALTVFTAATSKYAAISASQTLSVTPAPTAISFAAANGIFGEPVQLQASVIGGDGGGTVQFATASSVLCSNVALTGADGHWLATCYAADLPPGQQSVSVSYSGDADYSGGSTQAQVTIDRAPTSLSFVVSPTPTVAKPVTVTATLVTAVQGHPLSNQPLHFAVGSLSCDTTTDDLGIGHCELTASQVSDGGDLVISYPGDADHAPSQAGGPLAFAAAGTDTEPTSPATGTIGTVAVDTLSDTGFPLARLIVLAALLLLSGFALIGLRRRSRPDRAR